MIALDQSEREISGTKNVLRQPKIGDEGVIVNCRADDYLVESVRPDGTTQWLAVFRDSELEPRQSEHAARITWSAAQVRLGLPKATQTIDPAWAENAGADTDEAWSLVCRFLEPPDRQGNPSNAFVRYAFDNAPALMKGTKLRLFERGTSDYATVEILA